MALYLEHFGMTERPFTLLPDPDFLVWSDAHSEAFSVLEYGLMSGAPVTLITGEIGAGKTTLLREFLRNLPDDIEVGLISNAQGGRGELIQWALMALGEPFDEKSSYVVLFKALQDRLIRTYASGKRTILIVDEAQNLSRETLEELRLLTNINADKDELLQLILIGQPELVDILAGPGLEQIRQRIMAGYHLGTLDEKAVGTYIRQRLRKAGANPYLISDQAFGLIAQASGGTPRRINHICDMALTYAYATGHKFVDYETVKRSIEDRMATNRVAQRAAELAEEETTSATITAVHEQKARR
ncbi:ExeA family protein [Paracoccaceae bacterium GXU_MW_L88]